jgi:hypothetical protein
MDPRSRFLKRLMPDVDRVLEEHKHLRRIAKLRSQIIGATSARASLPQNGASWLPTESSQLRPAPMSNQLQEGDRDVRLAANFSLGRQQKTSLRPSSKSLHGPRAKAKSCEIVTCAVCSLRTSRWRASAPEFIDGQADEVQVVSILAGGSLAMAIAITSS